MADVITSKAVTLPSGAKAVVMDAPGIKNWRTLIINGLIVIVPTLLAYLAGINWSDYFSPLHAVWAVTAINIIMRLVTNGPVGSNLSIKPLQ